MTDKEIKAIAEIARYNQDKVTIARCKLALGQPTVDGAMWPSAEVSEAARKCLAQYKHGPGWYKAN